MDPNGFSDPYVRLKVGCQRYKTKVVKKSLNPSWCEEFSFNVDDLKEELLITVMDQDTYKIDDFVGYVKIPVSQIFDADDKSLGTDWYTLLPKNVKKAKSNNCGEILLTICFSQTSSSDGLPAPPFVDTASLSRKSTDGRIESPSHSSSGSLWPSSPLHSDDGTNYKDEKPNIFKGRFAQIFNKNGDTLSATSSKGYDVSEISESRKSTDGRTESPSHSSYGSLRPSSPLNSDDGTNYKEEKSCKFKGRLAQMFNKNGEKNGDTLSAASSKGYDMSEISESNDSIEYEDRPEDPSSPANFDELMKSMEMKGQGIEMPDNLPGGVVLDELYAISPSELNTLIFSPDSNFPKLIADFQGSTDLQLGLWKFENNGESLKRVVTCIKAATRLVKAVKAIEDQTYLKADGKSFAIFGSVNTPDAPYASYYRTEILTCITPGPELPSGDPSSHLVISWRMKFLQSTMMKSMIEGGARQGIKESFQQFGTLLSQNVKPVDTKDIGSEKEKALASLEVESQTDGKLAVQYFANFTVITTILMGLYVLMHVWLTIPSTIQGLEFGGLDLPDSIGELIVCGVLVLQAERVIQLISRFMQARVQKGSDHGIKAQGDGWLLTVALLEGSDLAAVDSSGFSDPYVVFTCNGKTKTSSIKFQKCDPRWNEIFEFDAMDDPPSTLDVEVFDFDGPFDEATSLGHYQINFVKTNISELADVIISLEGKLAQACQSKLHLRIFLNNTRGSNVVKEYLTKMEKEVGKKIKLRSPQTNSAFQKLFKLPPEEFLINDFTCHLKRKMPMQGRLFLSARIIGFHADLFGHKTNFFFLWEDIEDIQVVPPTLASIGSPVVLMTLRLGRGADAKHGAKTQDGEGRLKFHFQSFVSFNVAHRTIMALWKARSLSPEQKIQIAHAESEVKNLQVIDGEPKNIPLVEEESEGGRLQSEESGSFLGVGDVSLSAIYSSVLAAPTNYVMELFSGSELERRVMERAGCINYSQSPWEFEKTDVYQRQTYYKFGNFNSRYGGEVTSSQQKSYLSDRHGWVVEEVMTLHGVPLGDYFTLHLKYQIEDQVTRSGCKVQVLFGLAWVKSTKHQKRITKNIQTTFEERLMVMFSTIEKQHVSGGE